MRGFFDLPKKENINRVKGKPVSCAACGLYQHAKSPRMEPFGNFKKGILNVGEAPGCLSGNTLIEVAYRDKSIYPNGVPIKRLVGKKNFYVYSFDIKNKKIVLGKVQKVWRTGVKKTFKVTYEWFGFSNDKGGRKRYTNSIVVTVDHPFLLRERQKGWKDPFKGKEENVAYLSIEEGLQSGHSLQPFNRVIFNERGYISTAGKKSKIESQFLTEFKIGRKQKPNHEENSHHIDGNTLNDNWDNLECLSVQKHAQLHISLNNPMSNPAYRLKHKKVMQSESYRSKMSQIMREHLSDPDNYEKRLKSIQKQRKQTSLTVKNKFKNDPIYYYRYLRGLQKYHNWAEEEVRKRFITRFPHEKFILSNNHKIISIQEIGYEDVYDIAVEKYHNFAAQGIFVHNSTEDTRGKQWQGKVGRLLQHTYKELGIDLFEDCLNINAANCRPVNKKGNNRAPTDHEIACCRSRVWKVIEEKKPKVVIALGNAAITSLISHRWKKNFGGISKWRGWAIPDQDIQSWLCPTFHPSYIERLGADEANTLWKQDLSMAFSMLEVPFLTYKKAEDCVSIIEKPSDLPSFPSYVSFDYETTGIKPHAKGHRIVCVSIAYNENEAYAFIMPSSPAGKRKFIEMLGDPNIKKIAHNMKFEDTWSTVRLRQTVNGWFWDSMIASHILDNRPGVNSLKFQTYVHQGIVDYDSEIAPYLKGVESKNANSLNKVLELIDKPGGKEKLLTYCALDSVYTYRLVMWQREAMGYETILR